MMPVLVPRGGHGPALPAWWFNPHPACRSATLAEMRPTPENGAACYQNTNGGSTGLMTTYYPRRPR